MTNTENNLYNNFYDSELIVEFLEGVLPDDLHLKIQEQISTSEAFRTYVEGVQINYKQSGKNLEKMEADISQKKVQTWSKLQKELSHATPSKKLPYLLEQLIEFFRPHPQLEFELQPSRAAAASQARITVDDTQKILSLTLAKKNTQSIDFEIINNKMEAIEKHKIPAGSEVFNLSVASMQPGVYYAELRPQNEDDYMIRFYIREDLKPE